MRLTVAEAARLMGVSKPYIRIGLQRGLLPFGSAVKMSGRYTYYINGKKFFEYIGVPNYEMREYFATRKEYPINFERQEEMNEELFRHHGKATIAE